MPEGVQPLITRDLPPGVKTLSSNGYEMAYVEKGTGTPLILVHGAASDYRYFAASMDALSANYRVIAISLRYHYPERWDGKGEYSLLRHADDVVGFIRALDAGPVHLVGHSSGGTVAFFVAKQAPETVRSVISAEGMPGTSMFPPYTGAEKAAWSRISGLFQGGDVDEGLATFLSVIGGNWETLPDANKRAYRENAWTVYANGTMAPIEASCEAARALTAPFLLIQGERSAPGFIQAMDTLARCLSRVERVTIAEAIHPFPRTHPAEFSRAVLDFVAKH